MANRMPNPTSSSNNVVGVHYKVCKIIGEGSFGIIFEGIDQVDGRKVAIKFESRKSDAPQLRDEYRSYNILEGSRGIPRVYYFGQEGLHNILVLDLLGPSLEDLFELCDRKFDVPTVSILAQQMITRVQTIHEKNLIYRDIKPDNFLVHTNFRQNKEIFIVDFGMAKQYRDPRTKTHIPYRERKSLSGTARYMSINTHLGREQSRRDDLEALGHVFMYFLRGSLPWQGLKAATNKQKYEKIGEKKKQTKPEELCQGYPDEFREYLVTVRQMGFFDQPDYDYLRRLMADAHKNAKGTEPEFKWLKHPRVNAEFPSNSKEISNESNGAASNRFTVPKHLPPTPQRQAPSGYGSVIQNPHPVSQIPPQTIPKVLDSGLQQEQPEPTEHKSFFQKLKNFIFCSCSS